jgi:hypothetical protein
MMNDAGCFLDIYFGGLGSFGVLLLLGLSLLFFSFSCCLLGVSTPGVVLEGSGYIPNYKRGILSFESIWHGCRGSGPAVWTFGVYVSLF